MKKKKGFTLVELLAVIVILAVILVIAVPKIMDTINNSKEGTLLSSAKLIAAQAEKKYVENQTLGINDTISCDDVVKTTDDYDYCDITFDSDGKASVSIIGKDKFEGMSVCSATKTEGEVADTCYTDEACFAYDVEANEVLITGYDEDCGGDVWIPNTINNMPVVGIANWAFTTEGVSLNPVSNDNKNYSIKPLVSNLYNVEVMPIVRASYGIGIKTVKLPSTIEFIGNSAFQENEIVGILNFSNLTNLSAIGHHAFSYNQITTVVLPSSVEYVGDYAFGYNSLANITLGNFDAQIGCDAFGDFENDTLPNGLPEWYYNNSCQQCFSCPV